MRLLQLNLWEGRLIRQIPGFIKDLNPDLLCLQEVFSSENEIVKPSRMLNSLQEIQAVCSYPHEFLSPVFSSVYAGEQVDYGIAILSRFPLVDRQTIFTSGAYNPNQTATDIIPATRNLQTSTVRLPQGEFSIANHHGYNGPDGYGDETTVQNMQLVKEELRKLRQPLIFAGDLNVVPETSTMRVFDGFLEDLTTSHKLRTTLTQFGKLDGVACDHILISPQVRVQRFYADDALVSDHKALVLDFEIDAR